MLISFLPEQIQNTSTGFDVNTWQWESDSTVCSFIYQLSPSDCWLHASKLLLNFKSSSPILIDPMALHPSFAHTWCRVHAAVPLTGPLYLHRAALWDSQQEHWFWVECQAKLIYPFQAHWPWLLQVTQLESEQKPGTCCGATFKLLGFFWRGVWMEMKWQWVEKTPYQRRDFNTADS